MPHKALEAQGKLRVAVALSVTVAVLFGSVGAASTCDCGYGTGFYNQTAERCSCNCTPPFVLPSCIFTGNDTVRIYVVFDVAQSAFVSDNAVDAVKRGLGVNLSSSDVFYRWMATTGETPLVAQYPGKTVVQLGMPGGLVNRFLVSIDANASYVQQAHIVAASANEVVVSPPVVFGGSLVITRNPTTITVNTVGWLIGALLLSLCLACCEAGCLNTGLRSEQAEFDEMVRDRRKMDALHAGDAASLAVLPDHNVLQGRPVDDFFEDPTPEEIARRRKGLDSLELEDA